MTQLDVLNAFAVGMGHDPLCFPFDKLPCATCGDFKHWRDVMLVIEPGWRREGSNAFQVAANRYFECRECYRVRHDFTFYNVRRKLAEYKRVEGVWR